MLTGFLLSHFLTTASCHMALLQSQDASRWKSALASHAKAIEALAARKKDPSKLLVLDKWFHSPTTFGQKSALDKATLTKIVEWKLSRGTFRPGLLQKAASNGEAVVKKAYDEAKELLVEDETALEDGRVPAAILEAAVKAVKVLDKSLVGIGPATASAVLCRCFPQSVAFMSDEAMLACGLFAKAADIKYDVKTFGRFNEVVQNKARNLNLGLRKRVWHGNMVATALWADSILQGNSDVRIKPAAAMSNSPKSPARAGVIKTIKKK